MMGYSNTIYVSKNNMYISYQKNIPYTYYEQHNEGRFFEIVVPLLPQDAQSEINSIKNDNSLNSYQKWDKISTPLENIYNKRSFHVRKVSIQGAYYPTKCSTMPLSEINVAVPVARSTTSTPPCEIVFSETTRRAGMPMRSKSANFSPARTSRSS